MQVVQGQAVTGSSKLHECSRCVFWLLPGEERQQSLCAGCCWLGAPRCHHARYLARCTVRFRHTLHTREVAANQPAFCDVGKQHAGVKARMQQLLTLPKPSPRTSLADG